MAVKLRLTRKGTNKRACYRVVAADGRAPRDGRFLEVLGTYDPNYDPARINLRMERVDDWLKKGAQPTLIVKKIIKTQKKQATV